MSDPDHKPLPEEYVLQYYRAAKAAMSHTSKRRQWSDGKWGSPVGVLMLIAEIAHLKQQIAQFEAELRVAYKLPDAVNAAMDQTLTPQHRATE